MRYLLVLYLVFAAVAAGADEATTPKEIKLSNGKSFKVTSIVRFGTDHVVIKHPGGVDPFYFRHLAADQRETWEKLREAKADQVAGAKKTPRKISGQAFVATLGRENYKLGALKIYAVPLEQMQAFLSTEPVARALSGRTEFSQSRMNMSRVEYVAYADAPTSELAATTDAEGRYELTVPASESYYIFSRDSRAVYGSTEYYVWCVKVEAGKEPKALNLDNSNMTKAER